MTYEYLIGIRLATPDPSIALNQEPFSSAIFSAIEEYNSRSKAAPNPKSINLIPSNFFDDSFIITLTSEKELASAGKIDGAEVWHQSANDEQRDRLLKIAEEHNLITTGGSDFHGKSKPNLELGTGYGKLSVGDWVLEDLKAKRKELFHV